MGKFYKGILGGFQGTVGTVVGATWRGMDVLRSRPRKSNKPATDAQLEQRSRFKLMAEFLRPMRPVLKLYFGQPSNAKSKSNLATAYHMNEAVAGTYPSFTVDFQKVITSKGELTRLENPVVTPQANAILAITWTDNTGEGQAKTDDQLVIVVHNATKGDTRHKLEAASRATGNFSYDLPDTWTGDTVHVYLSVASATDKLYGNSEYFGPVVLL